MHAESILAGKELSFKAFLTLIWSLSNVELSALVGLSAKALGGPGKVVEIDEAKVPGYLC